MHQRIQPRIEMCRRIGAVTIALTLCGPTIARAADKDDVVAVVQAYNAAGNNSDRSGYAGFCTADAVVVDHVPPYLFQGPSACADEYDAVVAWGAKNRIGVDDLYQKVFEPVFFDVQGDAAYAVFPVKDWFRQEGRPQVEDLFLTTTLRRERQGWRMTRLVYSSLGWKPGEMPTTRP